MSKHPESRPCFGFAMRALAWFCACLAIASGITGFLQWRVNNGYKWAKSAWKIETKEVTVHNEFWQMVAGTKELSKSDTGKLAGDLRNAFVAPAKGGKQVDSLYRLIEGSISYPGMKEQIAAEVFSAVAGASTSSSITQDFRQSLKKFSNKGLASILRRLPREPLKSDPAYKIYNVFAAAIRWPWLVLIWTASSIISLYLATFRTPSRDEYREGMPEDMITWWNTKEPEIGWRLFAALLLWPLSLALLVWQTILQAWYLITYNDESALVKSCQALSQEYQKKRMAAKKARREKNHPYSDQIRQLRRCLKDLEEIKKNGRVSPEEIDQTIESTQALLNNILGQPTYDEERAQTTLNILTEADNHSLADTQIYLRSLKVAEVATPDDEQLS